MKRLIILTLIFTISLHNSSLAWDGKDIETNIEIEIGPGNLVREGNIIKIYDWATDSYHEVEILSMDYSLNSVRLEVYDLETKQKRILDMES